MKPHEERTYNAVVLYRRQNGTCPYAPEIGEMVGRRPSQVRKHIRSLVAEGKLIRTLRGVREREPDRGLTTENAEILSLRAQVAEQAERLTNLEDFKTGIRKAVGAVGGRRCGLADLLTAVRLSRRQALTKASFEALSIVRKRGPVKASTVARIRKLDETGTRRILNNLEKLGYIVRKDGKWEVADVN